MAGADGAAGRGADAGAVDADGRGSGDVGGAAAGSGGAAGFREVAARAAEAGWAGTRAAGAGVDSGGAEAGGRGASGCSDAGGAGGSTGRSMSEIRERGGGCSPEGRCASVLILPPLPCPLTAHRPPPHGSPCAAGAFAGSCGSL
ncbi:hypothetical protein ACFQ60_13105 [Streptomyces zhihengii]